MRMDEELFFPTTAAEVLGVSTATLRRYAYAWEKAIGPLPRAPGGGRLWPRSALARLKVARELARKEEIPLEEEIQDLKRAIETLQKQGPKKPWWRFF